MGRMALRGLAFVGCFIPTLMAAGAAEKMRPPLPKPKPAEIASPEPDPVPAQADKTNPFEPDSAPAQTDNANPSRVLPREKPVQAQRPVPELIPRQEDAQQSGDDNKPDPGEDFAICRSELASLGARFSIPEMPAADGKCKVPNPVQISAIGTPVGEVDFPGGPILNCIFAKRFTSWISDIAAPVVKAQTGEALMAVSTGPGYECRGRNGDFTNKISEHAFGNAIDIAAFKLASKESMPVAHVARTGNVESRWLMALRISACGYFTTVLGPGSNAAHAEHYHFDLGLHGKSGNYRICE